MARGRTKANYVSDILALTFQQEVPNNLFAQSAVLGWAAASGGITKVPKGLRPRHAIGKDSSGRTVRAVIGDVTSTLWTRAVTSWTFIDNFGATDTANLTGLVGEAVTF